MRYETQVPESRIILIVNPIGWEGDVRFMDQSQSEVMQNLINHEILSTQLKTALV